MLCNTFGSCMVFCVYMENCEECEFFLCYCKVVSHGQIFFCLFLLLYVLPPLSSNPLALASIEPDGHFSCILFFPGSIVGFAQLCKFRYIFKHDGEIWTRCPPLHFGRPRNCALSHKQRGTPSLVFFALHRD